MDKTKFMINPELDSEGFKMDVALGVDSRELSGASSHRVQNVSCRLEAVALNYGTYAVRPAGQLGTCGWHPRPWTVQYVKASSPSQAIAKVERLQP